MDMLLDLSYTLALVTQLPHSAVSVKTTGYTPPTRIITLTTAQVWLFDIVYIFCFCAIITTATTIATSVVTLPRPCFCLYYTFCVVTLFVCVLLFLVAHSCCGGLGARTPNSWSHYHHQQQQCIPSSAASMARSSTQSR